MTVNTVPLFSSLRTSIAPLCSWMIRRVMARPSPVPSGLVVKKGSNRRERFSGGMPAPVSLMDTQIWPGCRSFFDASPPPEGGINSEATVSVPFSFMASTAFRRRLIKACSNCLSSPLTSSRIGERSDQVNVMGVELVLNQPQRGLHNLVEVESGKCGLRRTGVFQNLADERIDALNFVADDAGDFGVFVSFQQEFCERFHRHQRILYFMRDAGSKDADTCQSIEPPEVHFDLSVPIQIVQQKNHTGFLFLADLVEGGSDLNADFGRCKLAKDNLPLVDGLARGERFQNDLLQRDRQGVDGMVQNLVSAKVRQGSCLAIEDDDFLSCVDQHDAGGE